MSESVTKSVGEYESDANFYDCLVFDYSKYSQNFLGKQRCSVQDSREKSDFLSVESSEIKFNKHIPLIHSAVEYSKKRMLALESEYINKFFIVI